LHANISSAYRRVSYQNGKWNKSEQLNNSENIFHQHLPALSNCLSTRTRRYVYQLIFPFLVTSRRTFNLYTLQPPTCLPLVLPPCLEYGLWMTVSCDDKITLLILWILATISSLQSSRFQMFEKNSCATCSLSVCESY